MFWIHKWFNGTRPHIEVPAEALAIGEDGKPIEGAVVIIGEDGQPVVVPVAEAAVVEPEPEVMPNSVDLFAIKMTLITNKRNQ